MRPVRRDSTLGVIGLAAIAAACCALPLGVAILAGAGLGGWLLGHGSLLAVPAVAASAGLLWWRSRQDRS